MPTYSHDIRTLLFEEDVRSMYDAAQHHQERLLISLLWITGPRPSEGELVEKEDVAWEDTKLWITLNTKKLGEGGRFAVDKRTLEFARPVGLDMNIYIETIIRAAQAAAPKGRLLNYGIRWQQKVINRLSQERLGVKLSPYHFRHSVMTWLARNGKTIDQLKYFKGAKSINSVGAYISARPFVVEQQLLRRSRQEDARLSGGQTEAPEQPKQS